MKTIRIYIEKAGLQTTIQDLGRFGLRSFGIPISGAMDSNAHQIANKLVGNKISVPTLEMTLKGDRIHFLNHATIAITGGDMSAKLNAKPCLMYETIEVKAGDILSFGFSKMGCRTYLAIQGKIKADFDFNSYSTYLYGKFGGYKGRKTENDDIITIENEINARINFSISKNKIPVYSKNISVKVIPAPEFDWFSKEMIDQFFKTDYKVTIDNNRMGMKLSGFPIVLDESRKMISSPTALGTIQVLPNGQLIILLHDGQTTGGYPRIANVVLEDIGKLVQLTTGGLIKFEYL
jgi:antagonist of KipI